MSHGLVLVMEVFFILFYYIFIYNLDGLICSKSDSHFLPRF